MGGAERHVRLAQQGVGHFRHGGETPVEFLPRPLAVHAEGAGQGGVAAVHLLGFGGEFAQGFQAAVIVHSCAGVVGGQGDGVGLGKHRAGGAAEAIQRARIALLRHDGADAGHRRVEHDPRARVLVLGMHVLGELADGHRRLRQHCGEFQLVVGGGDEVGVVAVLHRRVEAEQRRQPLPIQPEAGGAEGGGAERTAVEAAVAFRQALGVAPQRRRERQEVVAERGGLRLHAVGVGRHRRVGVGFRQREDRGAGAQQFAHCGQPIAARQHAPGGAVQILPRAADVDVRGGNAGQFDEALFQRQIVGRAGGARAGLFLHRPRGGVGDARRQLRVQQAFLRQHHQGRGVGVGHVAEEIRARRGRRRVHRGERFHHRIRERRRGGGDQGAVLLVGHLEGDGGNAETAVKVVLRGAGFGERAGVVLELVEAVLAPRRGQPPRCEFRRAGGGGGVLREEHVAAGGVEIQHQAEALALFLQAGHEVAHRLGFGLGELAPVAVQIGVPQIVPPMARFHAVRVHQGHHDEAVRLEEAAARLRLLGASAGPRLQQPLDEARHGNRAGHFRRVLPAQQQHHVRRVGVDVQRVNRPPAKRLADFAPTRIDHRGNPLAPRRVEGAVPVLVGGNEEAIRIGAQTQQRIAIGQPHGVFGQPPPRLAIDADFRVVAVPVFPGVAQTHRERGCLAARRSVVQRTNVKAIPRAGIDLAAILRADVNLHFVRRNHLASAEPRPRVIRAQRERAGGAGVGRFLRSGRGREKRCAKQGEQREERAARAHRHRVDPIKRERPCSHSSGLGSSPHSVHQAPCQRLRRVHLHAVACGTANHRFSPKGSGLMSNLGISGAFTS